MTSVSRDKHLIPDHRYLIPDHRYLIPDHRYKAFSLANSSSASLICVLPLATFFPVLSLSCSLLWRFSLFSLDPEYEALDCLGRARCREAPPTFVTDLSVTSESSKLISRATSGLPWKIFCLERDRANWALLSAVNRAKDNIRCGCKPWAISSNHEKNGIQAQQDKRYGFICQVGLFQY